MLLTSTKDLPCYPRKIISLVPSQTELLHFFGLEKVVTGITKFCIHPHEWFKNKTRVGGTKTVNINLVQKLSPDLIIANKEENVKEQVEVLAKEFAVWVTNVNNLEEAFTMINDIGELTNKKKAAKKLIENVKNEFLNIPHVPIPIRSCYIIWRNPYMTIGGDTFINEMMKYCGLQNIFSDQHRYPIINFEEIKNRNCELILLSSEPYPFKENNLKEVQESFPGIKIILADGEMFSWYGSRLLLVPGYFRKLRQLF